MPNRLIFRSSLPDEPEIASQLDALMALEDPQEAISAFIALHDYLERQRCLVDSKIVFDLVRHLLTLPPPDPKYSLATFTQNLASMLGTPDRGQGMGALSFTYMLINQHGHAWFDIMASQYPSHVFSCLVNDKSLAGEWVRSAQTPSDTRTAISRFLVSAVLDLHIDVGPSGQASAFDVVVLLDKIAQVDPKAVAATCPPQLFNSLIDIQPSDGVVASAAARLKRACLGQCAGAGLDTSAARPKM